MWFLQHHRDPARRIVCRSFKDALYTFYKQPKDADGVRPWTVKHKELCK